MSENNGWADRPGVPPKPQFRAWHWLYLYDGILVPAYWDGYWLIKGNRIQVADLNPQIKYWGECLTPDNGWPGKPGVPLNPERDGWHWLMCPLKHDVFPRFWRAAGEAQNCRWTAKWLYSRNDWNPKECTYLGPCLTPAEVDARIAAAIRALKEDQK